MGNSFLNSMAPITRHLMIINVLFWLASLALPKVGIDLVSLLGLHYWEGTEFKAYQFVTYMFLHDTNDFGHIFFNMFAVFMFGQVIERTLGERRFLFYYIVTGIGAALFQELAWMYDFRPFAQEVAGYLQSGVPDGGIGVDRSLVVYTIDELNEWVHGTYYNHFLTVGASGAVFGLLIAFALFYPNQPMYIMFIPIPIKAKYVMIGYAVIELFAGVRNFTGDNVAHFAHLGGALVGLVIILFWRKRSRFL